MTHENATRPMSRQAVARLLAQDAADVPLSNEELFARAPGDAR